MGCGAGREVWAGSPEASGLGPATNAKWDLGQFPTLHAQAWDTSQGNLVTVAVAVHCTAGTIATGQVGQSPSWLRAGFSSNSACRGKEAKRDPWSPWTGEDRPGGGGLRCHTEKQVQSPKSRIRPLTPHLSLGLPPPGMWRPWNEGLEASTCVSCFRDLPCLAEQRFSWLSPFLNSFQAV